MRGGLASLLAIFTIPLIALALEPSDPISFCDRFVAQDDIDHCQSKTASENVDWYVASICNMQKEDAAFWRCWESAKDRSINLQALKTCEDADSDQKRQFCVEAALLPSRNPASTNKRALFQPLKTKKSK